MSANLKRLDIADVDDSGEIVGAYIKKVHIVEVVDSEDNSWVPEDTLIGEVSFLKDGEPLDPNTPLEDTVGHAINLEVVISGDATDLNYEWSVRSGDTTVSQQGTSAVINPAEGISIISLTVTSSGATDSPNSSSPLTIVGIPASSQPEFEVLQPAVFIDKGYPVIIQAPLIGGSRVDSGEELTYRTYFYFRRGASYNSLPHENTAPNLNFTPNDDYARNSWTETEVRDSSGVVYVTPRVNY